MFVLRSRHKGILGSHVFEQAPSPKQISELGLDGEGEGWPKVVEVKVVSSPEESCIEEVVESAPSTMPRLSVSGVGTVTPPSI